MVAALDQSFLADHPLKLVLAIENQELSFGIDPSFGFAHNVCTTKHHTDYRYFDSTLHWRVSGGKPTPGYPRVI